MNNRITYACVTQRLQEANIPYTTISLASNWKLVVAQYGGRVFGPFNGENGESLLWMSDVWQNAETFKEFVGSRTWNVGGDRLWIQPELPFYTTEKARFFDTYVVQGPIDPGAYTLTENQGAVTLEQDVSAQTYEIETTERHFRMRRTVQSVANPFAQKAKEFGIDNCFGMVQTVEIEDKESASPTYLEAWLLSQINPRGELIVPFTGKTPDFLNYYEPIADDLVRIEGNKVFVTVTGDVRYKLGFKSLNTTGRSAYIGSLTDGTDYLFVRSFHNKPSSVYCGAPYSAPEVCGYPLYLYNDPGSQGGFAEFENCGTTIGGDTGLRQSQDDVYYYFFTGKREDLLALANEIL